MIKTESAKRPTHRVYAVTKNGEKKLTQPGRTRTARAST